MVNQLSFLDYFSRQKLFLRNSPLYIMPSFMIVLGWLAFSSFLSYFHENGFAISLLIIPALFFYLSTLDFSYELANDKFGFYRSMKDGLSLSVIKKHDVWFFTLFTASISIALFFYLEPYLIGLTKDLEYFVKLQEQGREAEFSFQFISFIEFIGALLLISFSSLVCIVVYFMVMAKLQFEIIEGKNATNLFKTGFHIFTENYAQILISVSMFMLWIILVFMSLFTLFPLFLRWISFTGFYLVRDSIREQK